MQKVIPPGLNYGDIKPEAIENQIRIVKFTPIATIQAAQPNDIVRFHLQGNGFYDPYSAYIRIKLQLDGIVDPTEANVLSGRFLDRSAHSLFSRLVIRSQGTELERIEQYDVMAAMVNDMIYSQEQRVLHHYEGFSHRQSNVSSVPKAAHNTGRDSIVKALPFLCQGAAEPQQSRFGDYGVWKGYVREGPRIGETLQQVAMDGTFSVAQVESNAGVQTPVAMTAKARGTQLPLGNNYIGYTFRDKKSISNFMQMSQLSADTPFETPLGVTRNGQPFKIRDQFGVNTNIGNADDVAPICNFNRVNQIAPLGLYQAGGDAAVLAGLAAIGLAPGNAPLINAAATIGSKTELEFTIPIYSGIIGVLMPTKKLIPMSLLPLEVEFTMNPHAFYPVGNETSRSYTVKRFEIWSHTMFFEQELHRSLEAAVAESGVFIHYNSFYLAPVNTYNAAGGGLPQYNQIGVFLKSINSLHWTFLYNSFEQVDGPRKLHFVCHNMRSLQVRNGMDLMPSEPILGQTGGDTVTHNALDQPTNAHCPFMIEMYKGWNKMHDPLSDAAINAYQYNLDQVIAKPLTLQQYLEQCSDIGMCQYAVSFEGDELGMNKSIISGKKSVMPFDINMAATKSQNVVSYMMCFLRADFIIYVRPDLVVTRLGL